MYNSLWVDYSDDAYAVRRKSEFHIPFSMRKSIDKKYHYL